MRVLIACEFSGKVRDSFTAKGHDVTSCDFEGTWKPGKHYQGDVRDILNDSWDLMIAFPPCTHLAISGARHFSKKKKLQKEALDFVNLLVTAQIPKIAIENPIGILSTRFRKPDQIVQPWMFGHGHVKSTCLWLKNLPLLRATNVVDGRFPATHYTGFIKFNGSRKHPTKELRSKLRSITYDGIAQAMADQWG